MRADRLFSIVMLLQTRGRMTANELSRELGVSERTLYRDLDTLSSAGIPLYADKGPGGGYALLESWRATLTSLTESEASALFITTIPEQFAALGMDKTLKGALLKLLAALPINRRQRIERERSRIHLDPAPWWQPTDETPFLGVIQRALWDNQRLAIAYDKGRNEEHTKRVVEPYGLVAKASWWYLVANGQTGIRTYRVARISDAQLLEETFERPADFDLQQYWKETRDSFETSRPSYPVTLRLNEGGLLYLRDHYGPKETQKMLAKAHVDDAGWWTLTITYERREWALHAVLGMGGNAEVLAPSELREDVLREVARLSHLYHNAV